MERLILASASPRRREILESLGIGFEAVSSGFEEAPPRGFQPREVSRFFAEEKAKAAARRLQLRGKKFPRLVLGADTTVLFCGEVYGKPKSLDEARSFLRKFRGNEQEVVTGLALLDSESGRMVSDFSVTSVKFKKMGDSEIELCLSKNEWRDAAGGYKIQGFSGCFVEKIDGEFSNVVGLPISKLYDMLKVQNFQFG